MTDLLTILNGDALAMLKTLPDESVQCCVTSPPYHGLRDYKTPGQIGLESTFNEFLARVRVVFAEVRRVLRKDGTCWVNMGDNRVNKQLTGQPWRLAFALQEDGWFLRQDIIWHKTNAMPESANDRPALCHEYVFLLSRSRRYYYDAEAIKEPVTGNAHARGNGVNPKSAAYKMPDNWDTGAGAHGASHRNGREKGKTPGKNSRIHVDRDPEHAKKAKRPRQNESFSAAVCGLVDSRNKRSVWSVATSPFPDAHFATYPPDLIKPCILAGSKPGDVILDPFGGSGTTGAVALELGRKAVLIELNPEYVKLIERRCNVTPGLALI